MNLSSRKGWEFCFTTPELTPEQLTGIESAQQDGVFITVKTGRPGTTVVVASRDPATLLEVAMGVSALMPEVVPHVIEPREWYSWTAIRCTARVEICHANSPAEVFALFARKFVEQVKHDLARVPALVRAEGIYTQAITAFESSARS